MLPTDRDYEITAPGIWALLCQRAGLSSLQHVSGETSALSVCMVRSVAAKHLSASRSNLLMLHSLPGAAGPERLVDSLHSLPWEKKIYNPFCWHGRPTSHRKNFALCCDKERL